MSARLFIAVALGDEDRRTLIAWAREAVGGDRGMRVVDAEQVHLTLAFLGHRPLDEVGPLSELVESFGGRPIPPLSTGAALWLSPRKPHVLTVAVHDETGALGALHTAVWDGLEELGYEREERRYRPHLTVARVRHGWSAPTSIALPPTPRLDLDVRGVTLMRSFLGGGPARYEELAHGTLGG
ncbi:MAG TPA: RNA 2',3'-cyclic phosphodiesterase [Baekduia sp.]|uniref:RNA 2',3'-cyclic phosphodiesterase n=1 Tax=Baekduia sp. TaxID=2600305 RepID=UPI002D77365C|nr:RNA 2',3'-cyclic phosphodiesterase [Baekduia sp.]HET6509258.1 RNA 2',3'-cyclic phosphodiesterase [Baekduia sp.]